MPSIVPEGGYADALVYLESSNAQCQSALCLVDHVQGDTHSVCEGRSTDPVDCVPQETIDERVYCTCQCAGSASVAALCDCPSGFECEALPGSSASICYRTGLAD
ncbi:MAG: hypothetical protein IPK60_20160 [Sandaracinaceae bacterium]|jgi:hypothetical protein|nr:hypothetical protein [Sandaracinaceae bacterium]